ncbi:MULTISPECIES: GNAT family N-acetyltransferase [Methylosinus]|nr:MULTISPECIES: GNAT family N-acetyltransferase [Methylosinus]
MMIAASAPTCPEPPPATPSSASSKRDIPLNAVQWALFSALVAAPPRDNPQLRAFLSARRDDAEPAPLTQSDDIEGFCCGVRLLDETLARDASEASGSSDEFGRHTFVLLREERVVAYYSQRLRRMRRASAELDGDAVAIMQLQRLAVDRAEQGRGVGSTMLRAAILRALMIGERCGARALCVHALSPQLKRFYLERGFRPMPGVIDPLGVVLTLDDVRNAAAS